MSEETNDNKGWIATIFDSISNGLPKLIEAFKKHGLMVGMFTVILIMLLWCVILNPIRIGDMIQEQWHIRMEKEKSQQTELIERRYEANEVVGDIMTKLLYKFKCNRVMLLEKSNGTKSLGNVDYLYINATMEFIDNNNPQIEYISEDLQRQMTMNLLGTQMINSLKHSKYLYYNNLQEDKRSSCRLLNKLKKEGEKQVIIYPFCDNKHRPLLILVICGNELDCNEIVSYIDNCKKEISDLLIFD